MAIENERDQQTLNEILAKVTYQLGYKPLSFGLGDILGGSYITNGKKANITLQNTSGTKDANWITFESIRAGSPKWFLGNDYHNNAGKNFYLTNSDWETFIYLDDHTAHDSYIAVDAWDGAGITQTGAGTCGIMVNWNIVALEASITGVVKTAAGIEGAVAKITAATTLGDAHHTVLADATAGTFATTLPAAAGVTGREYRIKKTDASANAVTVTAQAGELIDGANTFVLSTQYKYVTVQSDGTQWYIIANN